MRLDHALFVIGLDGVPGCWIFAGDPRLPRRSAIIASAPIRDQRLRVARRRRSSSCGVRGDTRMTSPASPSGRSRLLAATGAAQAVELAALRQELADTNSGVVALVPSRRQVPGRCTPARGHLACWTPTGASVRRQPGAAAVAARPARRRGAAGQRRRFEPGSMAWPRRLPPAGRPSFRSSTRPARRVHVEWASPFVQVGASRCGHRERAIHQASNSWSAEQAARQEAERQLVKDDLIAVLSHELRTPLNAISGLDARAGNRAPASRRGSRATEQRRRRVSSPTSSWDMSSTVTDKLQPA